MRWIQPRYPPHYCTKYEKKREKKQNCSHTKKNHKAPAQLPVLIMKSHFALLLLLLPSIIHGKLVNLRGGILQDEPKSTSRDLQELLPPCLTNQQAMGWFGSTATIYCTSNSNCTNPEKCMVESNGFKFECGDPTIYDQDIPLCD